MMEPFPDRKPLLGYYDEGHPEVADWEIKWALEHGLQFFVYCWYRQQDNRGRPVDERSLMLGHALHDGFLQARYADRFRFAILWENYSGAGVASREDLMENLLPFWINAYFKHPSYLKVESKPANRTAGAGKPLLFVYHLDRIIEDLGGIEQVRSALEEMRQSCRQAGLAGLIALCEYRGEDLAELSRIRDCGFDYAFSYIWFPPSRFPSAEEAIQAQLHSLQTWKQAGVTPFLPTATMGWDPVPYRPYHPDAPSYHPDTISQWRLNPAQFKNLLGQVKSLMAELPADSLGRRMLLLDNWNEWGEGHYIAPHAAGGFGYLKALREVFTDADNQPDYRLPQHLGLGPYDSLYWRLSAHMGTRPAN